LPATAAAISVTIDSAPPNPSADSTAQFTFHASGANGTVFFRCNLDGAGFNSCTSPKGYTNLHNGHHQFSVTAVDMSGSNTAEYGWDVADTTAPDTTIDSGPSDPSASPDATFKFSASEPGSTFTCALDGSAPAGCVSPRSYMGLAPGQHTFTVAATDVNGNTDSTPAQRSWTVVSSGDLDRGNAIAARTATLPIHGPYPFAGARFTRLLERRRHQHPVFDQSTGDEPQPGPPGPPCAPVPCVSSTSGENLGLPLSPVPKTRWDPSFVTADPQIAASDKSFLVMSGYDQVAFYDKGGNPLTSDKNGKKITSTLATAELFKPLLDVINDPKVLNVPPDQKNGKLIYGLDHVFDTRVLWDSYRKRFWIVSQAKSNHTQKPASQAVRNYRRDKMFAAVSRDSDPRDGFDLWWWDANPGNGSCTASDTSKCKDGYLPGYGADYFTLGISKHAIVEEEFVGGPPDEIPGGHQFDVVNVFRADKMVAGTCNTPQCGWSYWDIPAAGSQVVKGTLTPAVEHGPSQSNRQYVVGSNDNTTIDRYTFFPDDPYPPQLYKATVSVQPFGASRLVSQPGNADNGAPRQVNMGTNLGPPKMLRAVFRDGHLYVLKSDCTVWAGTTPCTPSIKLWQIDPATNSVVIDRSFGERGPGDGPTDVVGYGWPMMDVNKDDTIVIGYQRSGPTVFPEARYSVRFATDQDMRPSHVMHAGSYPLGPPIAAEQSDVGRLDVTGAAVDGLDHTSVWLLQTYSRKGTPPSGYYQLTVARVLGTPLADAVIPLQNVKKGPKRSIRRGARLRISGKVLNQGDGVARSVSVTALLVRAHGPTLRLGKTTLGTVGGGRSKRFTLSGRIPLRAAVGRYHVKLTAGVKGRQYDRANDVTSAGVEAVR
jgi:hypothetical protein